MQEIEAQYLFTKDDFKFLEGKEKKAEHSRRKFFCRKDVHEVALAKHGEKKLAEMHERIEQDRKRAKFEHDIDEIVAHANEEEGGGSQKESKSEESIGATKRKRNNPSVKAKAPTKKDAPAAKASHHKKK